MIADSSEEEEEHKLRRLAYYDITEGYSPTEYKNRPVYVKHFDYGDQIELDSHYTEVYNKAKSQGLPTAQEAFDFIKSEGLWTDQDSRELTESSMFLEGLRNRRKSLVIPSQIAALGKEIKNAEAEALKWQQKKQSLLHDTCESYTDNKVNDFSIWILFYKDKELKERLFSWEEFSELDKRELGDLLGLFMEKSNLFTGERIKHIAISGFFTNHYNLLGKDGYNFFDKPVYKLSFNQVNLLSYGRAFRAIFENVQNIPEEIQNDPDALLDFAETSQKAEKMRQKAQNQDGYSVVGATKKDMKKMGIGQGGDTISLSELARQKGGNLSVEDFAQD